MCDEGYSGARMRPESKPKMGSQNTILRWVETLGQGARVIFAISVVVFVLVITEIVASMSTANAIDEERIDVVEKLALIRARLEGELNSTLYLTRGMISYVATQPELTWSDFEPIAAEMVAAGRYIRNLALAPENVIRFVYPLAGNERALGMSYRENPQQWPAVKRAIELGDTVVAGPLDLVQGGRGIVARTPIFVQDRTVYPPKDRLYWGLAAIVIDADELFKASGVARRVGQLSVAVRGKDGKGAAGAVFLGDAGLFVNPDVVTQTVSLPNGTWQIAAIPMVGWGTRNGAAVVVRWVGIFVALIFGGLVYVLLTLERRNRALALHDQLTGLPNRRLMYDRLHQLAALWERSNAGFALLYLDLNEFKAINDQYGHQVGDTVLIEVSRRLLELTRRSDTVARVGGDEFIVLLPNLTDPDILAGVLTKLRAGLSKPIPSGNLDLNIHAAVGMARFPEDTHDADQLVHVADQNMYREKSAP